MSQHPFRPVADPAPEAHEHEHDGDIFAAPIPRPMSHRDSYVIDPTRDMHYDDEHDGAGFHAPSHELRPSSSAGPGGPPNLEEMPVPMSYLPPGAQPPQRFFGALDNEPYSRHSFSSSSPTLNSELNSSRPPFGGYHDSDYDSVRRLQMGGVDSAATSRYDLHAGGEYHDDPNDPRARTAYPMEDLQHAENKRSLYVAPSEQKRKRTRWFLIGGVLIALVIITAVLLYFFVGRKNKGTDGKNGSQTDSGNSSGKPSNPTANLVLSGGDGSKITLDDGTQITYSNSFGGTWYYDPNNPFAGNAQAQSYTPPLNQTFQFGTDKIYGVNLGGWLNPEPFIAPYLYEPYANTSFPAVDEWTLSENLMNDTARGGLQKVMEDHYSTFITEQDFAEIAGAGLNWVRIALPHWAVAKLPGEPFLEGVQWKYFLKAIGWARKYGLRINLDLHTVPGSQNGFNHSGKLNVVPNWLVGTMGIANAQRSLEIIRSIAEFIAQKEYQDVVAMFMLVNEPFIPTIGMDVAQSFYIQAHGIVRNITGVGTGKGPWMAIHDGFEPSNQFYGYMQGADRIALDTHPYLCFTTLSDQTPAQYASQPCNAWVDRMNKTMDQYGFTFAGEFAAANTDCGLWLNGVNLGTRYEATYNGGGYTNGRLGSCGPILDYPNWTDDYKQGLKQLVLTQMDVLQNWFYWTWKIGNSTVTGKIESPHWSYQLGLQQGWIPQDPRSSVGTCAKQGVSKPWSGKLSSWNTGGQGAGNIAQSILAANGQFPPTAIATNTPLPNGPAYGPTSGLPVYVQTGSAITLSASTQSVAYGGSYTATATIDGGNGWAQPSDTASAWVPISGCNYPDPWGAIGAPAPSCTPHLKKKEDVAPTQDRRAPAATPPPSR